MRCAKRAHSSRKTLNDLPAANAWRILGGVRRTWIDDPGARFEKGGTILREEGISVRKKKKSVEVEAIAFFFSRTEISWYFCMRVCSHACVVRTSIDARHVYACVHRRGASRRDVQCERAPWCIARNNYKHRGVTINLPHLLDNNKRITGMRCGEPENLFVKRGVEGREKRCARGETGTNASRGARDLKC